MPETLAPSFTCFDRCDRCGAQAHARATLLGCEPLLFCGHHFTEAHKALVDQGWRIENDNR